MTLRRNLFTLLHMADPPDIALRRKLNKLGKELARTRREQEQTMKQIAATIPDALEAGITKAEIAERAQISRPTLNRLLPKK